jgi:hypothetical protein
MVISLHFHCPDGTGDTIKKYLWSGRKSAIMEHRKPKPGERFVTLN